MAVMIRITLTKGHVALIDDEDADLAQHRWWASRSSESHVYPQRAAGRVGPRQYARRHLHREIGERLHGGPIPSGWVVDHINGDTLDNRRANLRVVLHKVNTWNQHGAGRDSKSGVRGVRLHRKRWQSYICTGHKMKVLGTFDTMEEARDARLAAEALRMEAIAA